MQGHTNVIDCIAWAPFECAKTIQQADFNFIKAGEEENSFGADNGTVLELETAEKPSQSEETKKEEHGDGVDLKKLSVKERIELLKQRKADMQRKQEHRK